MRGGKHTFLVNQRDYGVVVAVAIPFLFFFGYLHTGFPHGNQTQQLFSGFDSYEESLLEQDAYILPNEVAFGLDNGSTNNNHITINNNH